jgi:hypothetical protein
MVALLPNLALAAKKATATPVDPIYKDFLKVIGEDPQGLAQLYLIGETHGVPRFHQFYQGAIRALKQQNPDFNCVFVESPGQTQKYIEQFQQNQMAANAVTPMGIQDLFTSWDTPAGPMIQDWGRLAQSISLDSILSPELLEIGRQENINIYAVDDLNLKDFVNATYNEVELTKGQEAAQKHIADSGFTEHLAQSPMIYYRDQIIYRRNLNMSAEILGHYSGQKCKRGVAIVGAMHASRSASGGIRVYQKYRQPMNDILKVAGLSVRTVNLAEVDSISQAIGQRVFHPTMNYAVSSKWLTPDYWRASSDHEISVLIEK